MTNNPQALFSLSIHRDEKDPSQIQTAIYPNTARGITQKDIQVACLWNHGYTSDATGAFPGPSIPPQVKQLHITIQGTYHFAISYEEMLASLRSEAQRQHIVEKKKRQRHVTCIEGRHA